MTTSRKTRYILVGVADQLLANSLEQFPSTSRNISLGTLASVSKSLGMSRSAKVGLQKAIDLALPRESSRAPRPALAAIKVVHSMHENGPKLVEMSAQSIRALRAAKPGVRVLEEKFYTLARFDLVKQRLSRAPASRQLASKTIRSTSTRSIAVHVVGADQKPVANATVAAFWDYDKGLGDDGMTNKSGIVVVKVLGAVERLFVQPQAHYWSKVVAKPKISGDKVQIVLEDIRHDQIDALGHFYRKPSAPWNADAGKNVRIAVIDGGIGPHPDLKHVTHGKNFTDSEKDGPFVDNGLGHGTHVAGIIAGRGDGKGGLKGFAPSAQILSYRVCEQRSANLSSYALGRAIEAAVKEKCHLVNLSLALDESDEFAAMWINNAWNSGCVVIAAVGNDGRQPVGWPAAVSSVIGVSAFGRLGTFPADAEEAEMAEKPFGHDKKDFFANFSNMGDGVDFTAPGVGIVSTFPGGGYSAQSGTSMACPIVTGIAAQLLAANPDVLKMKPDALRSEAIVRLLFSRAREMGFGARFEGFGLCARV